MGEHTELTAKDWRVGRVEQDRLSLDSHQRAVAAWDRGFFDDLVIPIGDLRRDTIPRTDTSFEKLAKLPPQFRSYERPRDNDRRKLFSIDRRRGKPMGRLTGGRRQATWQCVQGPTGRLGDYLDRSAHRGIADGPSVRDPPPTSALWVDLR